MPGIKRYTPKKLLRAAQGFYKRNVIAAGQIESTVSAACENEVTDEGHIR